MDLNPILNALTELLKVVNQLVSNEVQRREEEWLEAEKKSLESQGYTVKW
jgi:sensor histidine kinase YesM